MSHNRSHKYEQRLFVMRDDGVLFGETIDPQVKALPELGIAIAPMDKPPDHLLWNVEGVTAYLHHTRPDPVNVFMRSSPCTIIFWISVAALMSRRRCVAYRPVSAS